jgi:hypothetical protein
MTAKFGCVAGDRNGAKFGDPLLYGGVGKGGVGFLVEEIDDPPATRGAGGATSAQLYRQEKNSLCSCILAASRRNLKHSSFSADAS